MKLLPTAAEKTLCLALVLWCMSSLVPQCWWTRNWSGNESLCTWWIACYAGLLLLSCAVAGTKRQLILGLVFASTIIPILIWNQSKPLTFSRGRIPYVGPTVTGMRSLMEAAIGLLVALCVVFAVSWGVSFLLDRFVGPLAHSGKKENEAVDQDDSSVSKSKRSLVHVLIPFLVVLFLVQAIGNLAGTPTDGYGTSGRILFPVVVVSLVVIGAGLVCRFRVVPAFFTALIFVLAVASGLYAIAIQQGGNVPFTQLIVFFGLGCVGVATVMLLLGRRRERFELQFSWLSLLLVGIAGVLCWASSKYDMYTLLLGTRQYDFAHATFIKNLHSHRNVRVFHDDPSWGNSSIDFEFLSAANDSEYFNKLNFGEFAQGRNRVTIAGMGPSVDLMRFDELKPAAVSLTNCTVSMKQLRELLDCGARVWITDCKFVNVDGDSDPVVASSSVRLNNGARAFLATSRNFELESELYLRFDEAVDQSDLENLLSIIERSSGKSGRIFLSGPDNLGAIDLAALVERRGFKRLFCQHVQVALDKNGRAKTPRVFEMILESEIGVSGYVDDKLLAWKLLLASKGSFEHNQNLVEYSDLKLQQISDSVFVYGRTEDGDAMKLWLPWGGNEMVKQCVGIESLESLSFDVEWLGDEQTSAAFAARTPALVHAAQLNQLVGLRELYFSPNEIVDLSKLTALKKIEKLQFATSTKGFRHDQFPNLKEVRLLIDAPVSNQLMAELKKADSLESLIVIDLFAINFSAKQFLNQANRHFDGRVSVSAHENGNLSAIEPDDFKLYRRNLRKQYIQDFLSR